MRGQLVSTDTLRLYPEVWTWIRERADADGLSEEDVVNHALLVFIRTVDPDWHVDAVERLLREMEQGREG